MRALALIVLCQFGDEAIVQRGGEETISQLISQLGADTQAGKDAAHRLMRAGKPAVPALIGALGAEGVNEYQTLMIRYYASSALSLIDDERATEALYGVLKEPAQHDWVKRNAAYAMGVSRFTPAAPWLARLARGTSDKVLRSKCILALALFEDREGENYMREEGDAFLIELLLKDRNPEMRIAAAKSLGDRRVEQAVDALAAALSDADHRVASNAARALARLKEKGWRAVGPLIGALDGKEEVLRGNARVALFDITGERFRSEAGWKRWWKAGGREVWKEKLKQASASDPGSERQ